MSRSLTTSIEGLAEKIAALSERVARLEARSEMYTPFPHVHDLFNQVKSEIAAVRETLARQETAAAADVDDLREIRRRLDDIEASLDKMAVEQQAHREEGFAREQQKLVSSLDALKAQVETLKGKSERSEKRFWMNLAFLVWLEKRLSKTQKVLSAAIALAGTLWGVAVFWVQYGAPVCTVILREIAEVIRRVNE